MPETKPVLPRNETADTAPVYYTIPQVEKLTGTPRQTLYYRIEHDIDGIRKHIRIDTGMESAIPGMPKSPHTKERPRYLLSKEYVVSQLIKKDQPKEETLSQFKELYYLLYDLIEEALEERGESRADNDNLFGNMKAIDDALARYVIDHYDERLERSDPERIRTGIRTHYFTSQRLLAICLNGLRGYYREMTGREPSLHGAYQ